MELFYDGENIYQIRGERRILINQPRELKMIPDGTYVSFGKGKGFLMLDQMSRILFMKRCREHYHQQMVEGRYSPSNEGRSNPKLEKTLK